MKRITTIATALLLATLFSCEQKQKTAIPIENSEKTVEKPQEIAVNLQPTLDSLKKIIGNKWVKQNPVLEPTQPSFFRKMKTVILFVLCKLVAWTFLLFGTTISLWLISCLPKTATQP